MNNDKKKTERELEEDRKYPMPEEGPEDDIFTHEKRVRLSEDGETMEEDLDVPGAELDDADENIGEEDEENNYYSLGGDNHEDAEEDNPDVIEEEDDLDDNNN